MVLKKTGKLQKVRTLKVQHRISLNVNPCANDYTERRSHDGHHISTQYASSLPLPHRAERPCPRDMSGAVEKRQIFFHYQWLVQNVYQFSIYTVLGLAAWLYTASYVYRGPQLLWYTLGSGLFVHWNPYFEGWRNVL